MKIKITFELDLAGTGYNVNKVSDISRSIQNLTYLLHELSLKKQMDILRMIGSDNTQADKDDCVKYLEQQVRVSGQIMNNITLEQ